MTTLTKFNNTLNELILSLRDVVRDDYPALDRTIGTFQDKLELLRKANPRKVMDAFIYFVYPYREEIMSKNEGFFLKKDLSGINEGANEMGMDSIVDTLHIKEIWMGYADGQMKDTIWEYFQVMIILSERFMEEKGGKSNFDFGERKM